MSIRYTETWISFEHFDSLKWGVDGNWKFLPDTLEEGGGKTKFEWSTGGKRNVVVTIKEECAERVKESLSLFV